MIYCVEDDLSIRNLMIYTLESAGYQAVGFNEGKELFAQLNDSLPQCIILDIMLPNEDGITILKKLKDDALTKDIPVIMASAKGSEFDKVIGLDCGADDYLVKPFGMMEMLSRVKAVLRRYKKSNESAQFIYKELILDTNNHCVTLHNQPLDLTFKEFELLKCLMAHPNIVYTREQLLEIVWGIDFLGESRTVDVHIGTLRNKLLDYKNCIVTIRSVGYLFKG